MSLTNTDSPRRAELQRTDESDVEDRAATDDEPSHVATGPAYNVFHTAATLKGELRDLDGADEAAVYFEYWIPDDEDACPRDDQEVKTTDAETLTEPGEFREHVFGLCENTVYEYRVVAEIDGTRVDGAVGSFFTVSL